MLYQILFLYSYNEWIYNTVNEDGCSSTLTATVRKVGLIVKKVNQTPAPIKWRCFSLESQLLSKVQIIIKSDLSWKTYMSRLFSIIPQKSYFFKVIRLI